MRGRKGDSPKTKAGKASSFRAADKRSRRKFAFRTPEERAAMLASLGGADDLLPPDILLESSAYDGALQVWRDLGPNLKRIQALTKIDRPTFARYCIHTADWLDLTRDIKARGYYHMVKTVSGDRMERLRPAVKMRDLVESRIVEIERLFGLNPADRYKMLRDQALVPDGGDLFAPRTGGDKPAPSSPLPDDGETPTGMLSRAAAPPPGHRPN